MVERWQRLTSAERRSVAGACAVVLLVTIGYQVQRVRERQPTPDPRSFPVSLGSPEAKLAALQLGRTVRWKNSTTRRLVFLLDVLAADCPGDTRDGLASLATRSIRELRRRGVAATPTQVLGGVEGMTDIGGTYRCSGFFERYVSLRAP